jgi:hypothetical protein
MINRLATLAIFGPPEDNRAAPPAAPLRFPDGRLRCPGAHCRGILNRHLPERCPDCLQAITRPPALDPRPTSGQ